MKGVSFLTVLYWLSIGGLLCSANHVDLALLLFYILYCMWLFKVYRDRDESFRFSKAGSYIICLRFKLEGILCSKFWKPLLQNW